MKAQKRKCQKGFQHTGRSIEAVCLQQGCVNDRLLCFYCIHQSHSHHSIAYLIPGLKSPLQELNKNSHSKNPEKDMKYIQKKFNNINNAWIKISDNLQNGIHKIQQRMMPQFNVIRQTFKKNSVQQIIRQLTSNGISNQKIQQYVNMINMVKRYKFNDIKKLKFMTFMIQNRLSKMFLFANNKINQIMNGVIKQTEDMNFLNFNVQKLIRDRNLFNDLSRNLGFYVVEQLNINSQTVRQEDKQQQYNSILNQDENCIIIQESSSPIQNIGQSQYSMEAIIQESEQGSSKNAKSNHVKQAQNQNQNQNMYQINRNQKMHIHSFHQNQQMQIYNHNQVKNQQTERQKDLYKSEYNLSNTINLQNMQPLQKDSQYPLSQHSNGFRSNKNKVNMDFKGNYVQEQKQKSNISQSASQQVINIDYSQNRIDRIQNNDGSLEQGQIVDEMSQRIYMGSQSNKQLQYKNKENISLQNLQIQKRFQQAFRPVLSSQIKNNQQNNRDQYQSRQHRINSIDENLLDKIQPVSSFNQPLSPMPNQIETKLEQLKQIRDNKEKQYLSIVNIDLQQKDYNNGKFYQVQINDSDANQKASEGLNVYNQKKGQNQLIQPSNSNYAILEQDSNRVNRSQKFDSEDFRSNQQFSCQFPSVDSFQECNNQENQIKPSYQFSYQITGPVVTLQNKYNLKIQKQFVEEFPKYDASFKKLEIFNQHNQFDDVFCLKQNWQDKNYPKQFQILKKYFIFSKDQQSQQSAEQVQKQKTAKKRVKWVENLIQGTPIQYRQLDSETRKKIKPNQEDFLQEKDVLKDTQIKNKELYQLSPQPMYLYQTRTRSQKNKLKRLLQQKNQQKQRTQSSIQKSDKQINSQSKQTEEKQKSYEKQPSCRQKINEGLQINQLKQVLQYEDENILLQQNSEFNLPKTCEKIQQQILQQQNIEHSQQVSDIENVDSSDKNQKFYQYLQQNYQQQKIQQEYYNKDLISYQQNVKYYSQKLDQNSLAQVSNTLLKKCQRNFIKHQTQSPHQAEKLPFVVVQIYGRLHEEIKKQLSLINQLIAQELKIYCDTMPCALNEQSVALICKMVNLKKLHVYWAFKLGKPLVKKLINSLPKLQELILHQFHEVDTQIATQIVKKLPNIRIFHYNSDFLRHLDKIQENIEFFVDMTGSQTKISPLYTLSKIKNLQNIWMSDVQDLRQAKQIIVNMKNLKQVAISAFERKNKDVNSLVMALTKKNDLKCLVLQSVFYKQQYLVTVIKNNPNLQTIALNQSQTITDLTVNAIADTCPNLEQLYFMLSDYIEGKRIFELKKLQTLVIKGCWRINVQIFKQGLKKLQNLKCLSLSLNNYWLCDNVLPSIAYLQNLTFLNLDSTRVSDKGMLQFVNLKNLTTLICGRTQITANGLFKFLQKVKSKLRKLGLSRQSNEQLKRTQKIHDHDVMYTEFQGKSLIKIGQLLPQLTHLSIGGFKNLYIQNFATLQNLKSLQYKSESLSQETHKFLQKSRLNLNGNC